MEVMSSTAVTAQLKKSGGLDFRARSPHGRGACEGIKFRLRAFPQLYNRHNRIEERTKSTVLGFLVTFSRVTRSIGNYEFRGTL